MHSAVLIMLKLLYTAVKSCIANVMKCKALLNTKFKCVCITVFLSDESLLT